MNIIEKTNKISILSEELSSVNKTLLFLQQGKEVSIVAHNKTGGFKQIISQVVLPTELYADTIAALELKREAITEEINTIMELSTC